MRRSSSHDLRSYRYLILADNQFDPERSKTANSAIRYLPEQIAAILDSANAGRTAQDVLGFGGSIPIVGDLAAGLRHEPTALLIGIAPTGGSLPAPWRKTLRTAMDAGLHIVSGLHFYLSADDELADHARRCGVSIHDLRKPPTDLPVSTGRARFADAFVVLTIGTDCNVGKMTGALQIRRVLEQSGAKVGFAPTGQTGILIEGWGIAVDAVVADFIGGAAERLVLDAAEGNDIVLVEGQGSLVHPGYSGVTLGLLHGSLPDAMVLCHQPSRRCAYGGNGAYEWMPLPSVREMIRICENAVAPLRPAPVIGVALNTYDLSDADARAEIARIAAETGLPTTDPVRYDAGVLADAILAAASRTTATSATS